MRLTGEPTRDFRLATTASGIAAVTARVRSRAASQNSGMRNPPHVVRRHPSLAYSNQQPLACHATSRSSQPYEVTEPLHSPRPSAFSPFRVTVPSPPTDAPGTHLQLDCTCSTVNAVAKPQIARVSVDDERWLAFRQAALSRGIGLGISRTARRS